MSNFNNPSNKNQMEEHKKIFQKYKVKDEKFDYYNAYNEMNYVSPSVHVAKYFPFCEKIIKPPAKWLEVGCGSCENGLYKIKQKGFDVWGFDITEDSVKHANRLGLENVILHSASDTFPYEDNFFDFLSACDVLEHLTQKDVDNCLREMVRVLKPNSHLLLASCPHQSTDHVHLTLKSIDMWIKNYKEFGMSLVSRHEPYGLILKLIK